MDELGTGETGELGELGELRESRELRELRGLGELGGGDRLRRPAGIRSVRVGRTKVTYVPDGFVRLSGRRWLPGSTAQEWAANPGFLDAEGYLTGSIGGLLVESGERALLIDTGFGPRSVPPAAEGPFGGIEGGGLLESLAAVGRDPRSIEAVAFTHLHTDHIGWAARSAFGAAAYLVGEPEWARREVLESHGTSREALDALAPAVRTVADGEEVFPGVRVRLTGGHTPGHATYEITPGDAHDLTPAGATDRAHGLAPDAAPDGVRRLIAFGDALHSPVQVRYPQWSAVSDADPVRSAEFRRRLVDELRVPGTVGFGGHFADVVFGRVRDGAGGPAWQPYDPEQAAAMP